MVPGKYPRRRSQRSSCWTSSAAFPTQPTSSSPPPPASHSAASSPTAPSSGSTASSTPRPSSASSTKTKACSCIPPSGLTAPYRQPEPSPAPATSPSPSSPPPHPPRRWVVMDISDGRVLLGGTDTQFFSGRFYREMVVCDPLHRQYLLLPPIPYDLSHSVKYFGDNFWETFLVPCGDEAAIDEERSFRVICMVQCKVRLMAFVFSSSTRQWQAIPTPSWTNLFPGLLPSQSMPLFTKRERVFGCFYWLPMVYKSNMLVLDPRRMEFFIAEPPPEAKALNVSIATMVESGEGRPRMLTWQSSTSGREYTIWRKHGGSSGQWQKEKIFTISPRYYFTSSVGEYLLLEHCREHFGSALLELSLCTLDIETIQIKRVCALTSNGCAYSNYPPSLSSPTV
ncbi:hypothetical protein CFC21_082414 [Triticum aestivum]|uniref:F-box associated domain-containing protein n=2 Tax=Triticum aestivum TaxID=4565 RepID=A0A3B6NMA2_WHEAT|nr:hypothetical protein CFC21_082414 [Triticum aestivum]